MDAIFKFPSSEFNEELFKKILALLKDRDADITIAVHDKAGNSFREETNDEYWIRLNKSVTDIEEGKGVTYSMDELNAFINH
ncbi:hypothetical protein BH11BAC5_BH11BAC5_40280 [soil metagenome]